MASSPSASSSVTASRACSAVSPATNLATTSRATGSRVVASRTEELRDNASKVRLSTAAPYAELDEAAAKWSRVNASPSIRSSSRSARLAQRRVLTSSTR